MGDDGGLRVSSGESNAVTRWRAAGGKLVSSERAKKVRPELWKYLLSRSDAGGSGFSFMALVWAGLLVLVIVGWLWWLGKSGPTSSPVGRGPIPVVIATFPPTGVPAGISPLSLSTPGAVSTIRAGGYSGLIQRGPGGVLYTVTPTASRR